MSTLIIASIHPGFVRCAGRFQTANGKGMHALLQSQIGMTQVAWARPPVVGDRIQVGAHGTYLHEPKLDAIS